MRLPVLVLAMVALCALPVLAQPTVHRVIPANGADVAALTTVVVGFTTATAGTVGHLTMNATVDAGAPTSNVASTTHTWTLAVSPNRLGAVDFSLDTSAITGFVGATYTWSITLTPPPIAAGSRIAFAHNTEVADFDPGFMQYVNFLNDPVTGVYPGANVNYTANFYNLGGGNGNWNSPISATQRADLDTRDLIVFSRPPTGSARVWGAVSGTPFSPYEVEIAKPCIIHDNQMAYRWNLAWDWTPYNNTLMTDGKINCFQWNHGPSFSEMNPTLLTDPMWDGLPIVPSSESFTTRSWQQCDTLKIFATDTIIQYPFPHVPYQNTFWDVGFDYASLVLGWPRTPTVNPSNWDTDADWHGMIFRYSAGAYVNATHVTAGKVMLFAYTDSNHWFAADAYLPVRKALLRGAILSLYNPPFFPVVSGAAPAPHSTAGLISTPIHVYFSKPVTGVLAGDLTVNASGSGMGPWTSTSATPFGAVGGASTDWVFDGPWSTSGLTQGYDIYATLTAASDSHGTFGHIVDAGGKPLNVATYSWNWTYDWTTVPAAEVPAHSWVQFE